MCFQYLKPVFHDSVSSGISTQNFSFSMPLHSRKGVVLCTILLQLWNLFVSIKMKRVTENQISFIIYCSSGGEKVGAGSVWAVQQRQTQRAGHGSTWIIHSDFFLNSFFPLNWFVRNHHWLLLLQTKLCRRFQMKPFNFLILHFLHEKNVPQTLCIRCHWWWKIEDHF